MRSAIDKTILATSASALALTLALGAAAPAFADDAQVSEVVVTAERRSTNIQATPVAITAVTGDALDQSFATHLSDISAEVPSLEITKTAGMENIVTIRGVGSETPENTQSTSPGVSVFEDGVYLVNSIALNQTLFDIDHVEVLRGPQGDLYGESSIGGAIALVTKAPQLHAFDFKADASGGDYSLYRLRAEANIPINDTLAVRVSAQTFHHDGFAIDTNASLAGYDEDNADDTSAKVSLLWKPRNDITLQLTGEWYNSDTHGAEQKNINPASDPEADPRRFNQDYPGLFNINHQLYHANFQWDLPYFTIKSVTGFEQMHAVAREDSSRSSFNVLGSYDDVAAENETVQSYTEEFDLLSRPGTKLDWIAGAFAINEKAFSPTAEFEGPFNACAADVGPVLDPAEVVPAANIATQKPFPCNLAYGNLSTLDKHGEAVFARFTYHLLPNLRISAGARYNYDHSSNHSYNFSEFGSSTNSSGYEHGTPTWRFEADYNLAPQNLIYASYARGYKPGGVNGSPCIGFSCPQVVKNRFLPELNDGFEVGSKNTFFGHTLQFNADVFYYSHYQFQYIEQDPVPFDDGIANIPRIQDYGLEVESHYRSTDSRLHIDGTLTLEKGEVVGKYLTIDSTIANQFEGPNYSGANELATFGPCAFSGAYYNPACYAQVEAAAVNIQGKSPPAMPNVSGAISAAYDFDVGYGTLTPWAQVVYRGDEWARIFNEPSLDKVPSYTVVNLNLTFVPKGDKRWKFSLAATNITDEDGINSQYTDPYGTAQTSREYIPPRQVIGTISFAY